MGAMVGAVQAGAHALETDVHLSADGVVVLSHDPSLKRCFGVDRKIRECGWEYLSRLRTLREPREPMPRLRDLLAYLAGPGQESIWVFLDIKVDDPAPDLIGAIAETIAAVPGPVPWEQRIVLGCWNATFLDTARRTLPSFPAALSSFTPLYARHFLPHHPRLALNLLQKTLVGPLGARLLRDARARGHHPVYAWTVNTERAMAWCLRRNQPPPRSAKGEEGPDGQAAQGARLIDGVITDDPKLFLDLCRRWEDELDGKGPMRRPGLAQRVGEAWRAAWEFLLFQFMAAVFYFIFTRVRSRLDFHKDARR